jgi:hypothetical protein
MVVCVALLHCILIALISLTAIFAKSEKTRDAALDVLRVLTRHAAQVEQAAARRSTEANRPE